MPSNGDLFVVGYDLEHDQVVHIGDASLRYWHARGYRQRETLVCAMCRSGRDAPVGTLVPLVVVGVVGGQRRPHFRHPPHMAPAHEHEPESVWHLTAKAALASWARQLANVREVSVEWVTPYRTRRSDVRVRLTDGSRVAFEVQSSVLGDIPWLERHEDYQRQGIRDIWLWRPGLRRVHWIVAKEGEHLWEFDPKAQKATLLVGEGRPKPPGWWRREGDKLRVYGLHAPPTVHARLRPYQFPLSALTISSGGLDIPDQVTSELAADHARQRTLATEERAKAAREAQSRSSPWPDSNRSSTTRKPIRREDPAAAAIRQHYGDSTGRELLKRRGKRGWRDGENRP